jgi:CBS domain containing-hemolysin-like protein
VTLEWILLICALLTPLLGRRLCRRDPSLRPRPLHGRALLTVLAVSAAFWIALAWNATVPANRAKQWDPALFLLIAGVGVAWVESALLLGRGRSTRSFRGTEQLNEAGEVEGDLDPEAPPPALSDEAQQLLTRVLDLSRLPVERIMTPRSALIAVEASTSVRDTLARMRTAKSNRVLVIEGSIDRILGVAHAKDLIGLAASGETNRPVRGLARRLLRVPRQVPTSRVIEEFQQARVSVGVVGDARGRTLGLVTRKDVFRFVATGVMAETKQ